MVGGVLDYGDLPSSGALETCQGGRGRDFFFRCEEGACIPNTLQSSPCAPRPRTAGTRGGRRVWSHWELWAPEVRGAGWAASVSKPRPRASAGLDLPLRSWATGPGPGCCGTGERGEARARAAGTGALAREQRGAAPRIPRIPARPRFCRHVVALRAALTVRLGEGAHSRPRSACGPPRTRSADAGSRHSARSVHSGPLRADEWGVLFYGAF